MGPSPSEGAEMERRNSQESANYRRPEQHQPQHHVQPSNPGKGHPSTWGLHVAADPGANGVSFLPSVPTAAAGLAVLWLQGARSARLHAAQCTVGSRGE